MQILSDKWHAKGAKLAVLSGGEWQFGRRQPQLGKGTRIAVVPCSSQAACRIEAIISRNGNRPFMVGGINLSPGTAVVGFDNDQPVDRGALLFPEDVTEAEAVQAFEAHPLWR